MTIVELVRVFAEPLSTAVVLTDTDLERPGPAILYVNPALACMSGYSAAEMLGTSPRLLQGPGTNQQVVRLIAHKLRATGRYHGVLENYRKSGEAYLCEIDVRRLLGRDGEPLAYLAFEREVVRRRGRPSQDPAGRYRPVSPEPPEVCPMSTAPSLFA